MTQGEFASKWDGSSRTERAASQEHFIDLCRMIGVPTPNEADPSGDFYAFEKGAPRPRLLPDLLAPNRNVIQLELLNATAEAQGTLSCLVDRSRRAV